MSEPQEPKGSAAKGVGLAFLIILITTAACVCLAVILNTLSPGRFGILSAGIASLVVFGFGITQIPGVLFYSWRLWRRKEMEQLKGLLITGSIFLLLNAGCYGFFNFAMASKATH